MFLKENDLFLIPQIILIYQNNFPPIYSPTFFSIFLIFIGFFLITSELFINLCYIDKGR
jgi:hypothetical protein